MKITDEMVSRFLGWRLPKDFAPDAGISFKPVNHPDALTHCWPVGTNLFTADQAKEMLEHVLAADVSETAPRYIVRMARCEDRCRVTDEGQPPCKGNECKMAERTATIDAAGDAEDARTGSRASLLTPLSQGKRPPNDANPR